MMQGRSKNFHICLAVLILVIISIAVRIPLTVLAYWGNLGGCPALMLTNGDENGDGATFLDEEGNPRSFAGDYTPVFNSIVNNPNYGDERNFVSALGVGQDIHADIWKSNTLAVEDGKTYFVRMYIHNNNPNGEAATATGTRAAFSIPEASGTQIKVGGWINSDNANATQIYDDVVFQSSNGQPFHLEYVHGSAILWNNGFASANGTMITDDAIVTGQTKNVKTGALIGYEGFDGKIPGCFEYTQIICIQVRVSYDNFLIDKKMRLAGTDDDYVEELDVKVGDKVEFKISYKNALPYSETNDALNEANIQHSVMIRDILPNNMVYVPNTTRLFNADYPKGTLLSPDGDLFTRAVNIGNYGPQSNGYVFFTAEVVDKSLSCGGNALVNWAQATVGQEVHQDRAVAHTTKVCGTTRIIIKGIIGAVIILCLIDIVRLHCKLRRLKQ